jgi:hypothetical protein
MCLPVPYITSTQLQIYYTANSNWNSFLGGNLVCSSSLYSGSVISFEIKNLAAYKFVITYKVSTDLPGQQYNVSLNSTSNSTMNTKMNVTNSNYNYYSQAGSSTGYKICNSSKPYYVHIANLTFTGVKMSNMLSFATSSVLNIYFSEILIVAFKCSSLCLECS